MPRNTRLVTWNGKDLPPGFRDLPVGRYLVGELISGRKKFHPNLIREADPPYYETARATALDRRRRSRNRPR